MYNHYGDHCTLKNKRVSSKSLFAKVFHKSFNLKFVKNTKSNCHRCTKNANSESEKTKVEQTKQIHVDNKAN